MNSNKPSLFLAITLMLVTIGSGVRAQEIYEEERGFYSTREIRSAVAIEAGGIVSIQSASILSGQITVVADDIDSVAIVYVKKSKTDSRSSAIDYIDLVGVSLGRSAQGVRLQMRAPNPAPWQESDESGLVDVELRVPERSAIEISARLFDVTAEGPFSSIVIPSSLGRIDIYSVDGILDITTANQRVILEEITGEISVVTSNAKIEAIGLEALSRPANFRNDGGDILIEDFVGEINVRNSFGRISIIDFQPRGPKNYIRGISEPILLEISDMQDARLIVSNRYEDIELVVPRDISAILSLAVDDDNSIEANNLIVKPDLIEDNRMYLISGTGSSTLSASIQGRGNIFIQGRE